MDLNKSTPPGWGKDSVTKFFDFTRGNQFATFHQLKRPINRIIIINNIFEKAQEYMNNSDDWPPLLFFLKTHSSFLSAAGLATSGQMSETFMLLRGAIENALYGLYIFKNPNCVEIWLKRDESEESSKIMKETFIVGNMFAQLEAVNSRLKLIVKTLYDRTIDYGGHPNPNSILPIMQHNTQTTGKTITDEFKIEYLTANPLTIVLSLKTTAQVGIACLKMLGLVLPQRFMITGLDKTIDRVSKGL